MIKLIKTFLGVEATSKSIRGRKSHGSEDLNGYNHWRKVYANSSPDSLN